MKAAGLRGSLLALAWLSLARGAADSLPFGAAAVAGVTALSLLVLPAAPARVRVPGIPSFVGHFVRESLVGGFDVASRAVAIRPALDPALIVCRLTLPSVRERVLLADLVSLLPGTLSADLDGCDLTVHALDRGRDIRGSVRAMEARIHGLRLGGDT